MGWFKKNKKKKKKKEDISPQQDAVQASEQEVIQASELEVPDNHEQTVAIDVSLYESQKKETEASSDSQPESGPGFIHRLRNGLSKTREILTTDIDDLFTSNKKTEELLEEIEERLITSDIGIQTTMELMENLSKKSSKISNANQLKTALRQEIISLFNTPSPTQEKISAKPHIVMVVGVNGVGKTTTIGKLAAKAAAEDKKVLIAAADTFRAAAVEQLTIWADRAGADIVKHRENADPAAVAYDSVEAATARGKDIVFVDTAGRLHTKVNLMEELKKIRRAMTKTIPDAPHEVLLVLDATTGQNALSQAQMFNDALGVTGIALTKLDGTARGGIVVSICNTLNIPLKYIGIGEQIEDLQEFDPAQFVDALF
ncbi:signal recognition particle-docking protein FtsY [Desulfonema magnum]|uniref:Signal recognition particle receptor FtsY n=1 Tax=Desulfonema magnum TaxID=45655 RepID=A0A975BJL9_9BACT|nr:signal recognition particle-docking protein FtsY [Desulfonema magnum]QTA86350.1 Signal recognition particle receptor [Desulfonema magnum]